MASVRPTPIIITNELCKQQYNHQANENKRDNEVAYANWVSQHTPEQIRLANNARSQLRRKLANGKKTKRFGHGFSPIKDDRQVKRPTNAFFKFNTERQQSGELKNIQLTEAVRLVKKEWDALSEGEKKVREPLYASIFGWVTLIHIYDRNMRTSPPRTRSAMPANSTPSTAIRLCAPRTASVLEV